MRVLPHLAVSAALFVSVTNGQDGTMTITTTTGSPTTTLISGSNQNNPLAPIGNFFDRLSATTTTTTRPAQSPVQSLLSILAPDGVDLGAAVRGLPVITKFISNISGTGNSGVNPALASAALQLLSSSTDRKRENTTTAAPNPTAALVEGIINEVCRFRTPVTQFVDVFVSLITMNPALDTFEIVKLIAQIDTLLLLVKNSINLICTDQGAATSTTTLQPSSTTTIAPALLSLLRGGGDNSPTPKLRRLRRHLQARIKKQDADALLAVMNNATIQGVNEIMCLDLYPISGCGASMAANVPGVGFNQALQATTSELVKMLRDRANLTSPTLSLLLPPAEEGEFCPWMADHCTKWDASATRGAVNAEDASNTPGAATTSAGSGLLNNAMENAGSLIGCGEDVDCLGSALEYVGLAGDNSKGSENSENDYASPWSFSSIISPLWEGVSWLADKQPE